MKLRALLSMVVGAVLTLPLSAAEIKGRVLNAGKPVAGVTVSALPYETPFEQALREARKQDLPRELASSATRADGTFALPLAGTALGAGAALRLKLSGGGVPALLLAGVFDAGQDQDIGAVTVGRSAALAGKVLGATGAPLAGAIVTLWPGGSTPAFASDGALEPLPVSATTGADGLFKFESAGEAGNRLRVEAPGHALVERQDVRKGALRAPIALQPGRSAEGVVLRADRRTPAAGAVVRFQDKVTSRWMETAVNGTFRVEGLPAGDGLLTTDGGDLGGARAPLPEKGKATLVLAPWSAIAGRVVDARSGAPIARIRIVARSEGALFFAHSGGDGRYALRGLPARNQRLSADDPRYVPWTADGVHVTAGATTSKDVALTAAATLGGRVLDESGAPIAGARGVFSPPAVRDFQALMRRLMHAGPAAFETARDGSFQATRLQPGDGQTITVSHDEYEARTLGLSLQAGAANAKLTVVLRRGLTLTGVVKDQSDQPLSGVELELSRMQSFQSRGGGMQLSLGGMGQIPKQTSAADGRFAFQGLTASQYALAAKKSGFGQKRVDPVVVAEGRAPEPVEVVLSPGATIAGFVHDSAGKGLEGLRVLARISSSGNRGAMIFPDEPTTAEGAFTLEGLNAGESYDLQLVTNTGSGPVKPGVLAPAEGVEFTTASLGGLAGTVTEADGERPVTEFSVTYRAAGTMGGMRFNFRGPGGRPSGPDAPVAVQSADGQFKLVDVPAGKWNVEVKAEGYQDGTLSSVVVEENRVTEGVIVKLSRGATLTGRALDAETSKPIVDVQVRARLQGDPRASFSFPIDEGGLRATSDGDGRFELKGLAAGSYTVTASHPDHTDATETVAVKDQPASVDLRLERGSALAGSVVSSGRPVSGATVDLTAAGDQSRMMPFAPGSNVVTGENGRFRFDHLSPGRYTVAATLRNTSSEPVEAVLQGAQTREDLVLALGAGALIQGHVVGLPDDALVGLMVNANGPDGFFATTRTAAGGSFEFPGVPKGPIGLSATSGDFMRATRRAGTQVVVAEGQTELSVELRFDQGFSLSGHVRRGGQPLADMLLFAFKEGGTGQGGSARTDDAGAYVLEGLLEGTYNLHVNSTMGGTVSIARTVKLTGDQTLDIDAPLARLAGTVVEAATRRPLADASVWFEAERGQGGAATTDSAGHFALENLEPRVYHLSARKPAYQVASLDTTASEDSDVLVELRRGEGIGLVARDGIYGTPLRNVDVRVLDAQTATVFRGGVQLDGEGRGEIPSLQPGSYQLRAQASGYAAVTLPQIAVPSAALALALTPGGHIEVYCGAETLARPEASARLLTSTGQVHIPWIYSNDGVIRLSRAVHRIENVAPGRYTLSVADGPSPVVDVREGETATVTLP